MTTRGKTDVKNLVQEIITEVLKDETFLSAIIQKVLEKTDVVELQDKIKTQGNEISELRTEIQISKTKIENMERASKINQIRIIGMEESDGEKVSEKVIYLFADKMQVNGITEEGINCYRIGKVNNRDNPRQIIVKFRSYDKKLEVMKARRRLKGSDLKISVVEDLTKVKHEIYKAASELLGKKKVWTFNGSVYTKLQGKITEIRSVEELDRLGAGTLQ